MTTYESTREREEMSEARMSRADRAAADGSRTRLARGGGMCWTLGLAWLALIGLATPARAAGPERAHAPGTIATAAGPAASNAGLPADGHAPIAAASEGVQGGSGGTEVTEYYGYDAIGSVRMVFDPAGNIVGQSTYTPFGAEVYGATGMPSERFTSQERDHEAGLDHFNARAYQVRTGRFGTVDPAWGDALGNPQRWNRYSYVLNNPLAYTDPTGENLQFSCDWTIGPISFPTCDLTYVESSVTVTGGPWFLTAEFQGIGWFAISGGRWGAPGTKTPTGKSSNTTQSTGGDNGNDDDDENKDDGKGKSGCAQTPPGTKSQYCGPLKQGIEEAKKALEKPGCGAFYGGRGPETLDATTYRFLDMKNPTTGAGVVSPSHILVNINGPYMNFNQTGQLGPFNRFWTQGEFRGFILLHELGHQLKDVTGFGSDAGNPSLNQVQSGWVVSHCY